MEIKRDTQKKQLQTINSVSTKLNRQKSSHITEQDCSHFHNGTMTEDELLTFMEHIGTCNDCAGLFAAYEEQDLIHPPVNFKRDIVTETSRLSRAPRSAKQAFYRYCLQVGFSMAASLVLVFSGSHLKLTEQLSKTTLPKTEFSITAYMNDHLEQLTNTISNSWEELFHDKEEK